MQASKRVQDSVVTSVIMSDESVLIDIVTYLNSINAELIELSCMLLCGTLKQSEIKRLSIEINSLIQYNQTTVNKMLCLDDGTASEQDDS
jgi:hypothetical protein